MEAAREMIEGAFPESRGDARAQALPILVGKVEHAGNALGYVARQAAAAFNALELALANLRESGVELGEDEPEEQP